MAYSTKKNYGKKHRRKPRRNKKRFVDTTWFFWVAGVLFVAGLLLVFLINRADQKNELAQKEAITSSKVAAKQKKKEFIAKLVPEAQALQKAYQLLPSVTLAQAILESDWGQSELSMKYHNLFGIKGSDSSNTAEMTTQEYVNGSWTTVTARFRVYDSYQASMADHAQLFLHGTSWNPKQYEHFLAAKEYQSAAKALQQDGYATDPDYATKLITIIETYQLNQYDATA